MRTILELLIAVKEKYIEEFDNNRIWGLCNIINTIELKPNNKEYMLFINYLANNFNQTISRTLGHYYWDSRESKPRIKWLNKHIKLQQKKINHDTNRN